MKQTLFIQFTTKNLKGESKMNEIDNKDKVAIDQLIRLFLIISSLALIMLLLFYGGFGTIVVLGEFLTGTVAPTVSAHFSLFIILLICIAALFLSAIIFTKFFLPQVHIFVDTIKKHKLLQQKSHQSFFD